MECLLHAALSSIEAIAALIISHYDPAHSLRPEATGATPRAGSYASSRDGIYRTVLQTILDPSPTAFIFNLSIFALAALFGHHLNRHHRLQHHFLIVGVCLGVIFSTMSVFIHPGLSLARELQTVLPWTILMASMASSLIHWSVGGVIIAKQNEDKNDESEVVDDRLERKAGSFTWEKGNLGEK